VFRPAAGHIVLAYQLSDEPLNLLNKMPGPALAELIIAHVRQRVMGR
jgi:hypothetical protein